MNSNTKAMAIDTAHDLLYATAGGHNFVKDERARQQQQHVDVRPFRFDDKVEVRNSTSSQVWQLGKISREWGDDHFDITFEDGQADSRVPSKLIRHKFEIVPKIESEEIVNCCADLFFGLFVICCTDDELAVRPGYAVPKAIPPSFNFDRGLVVIKKITASSVKSVEFIGKNDLYLNCFFGDKVKDRWAAKTNVLNETGANGTWKDLGQKFVFEANPEILAKNVLKVQCFDKNTLRNDVLIGEGSVSIAPMADTGYNREKNFEVRLLDKTGKYQTGIITFSLYLSPP